MFLKRIRIDNVRAIAGLELDFDGEHGGPRKWTLLLGENGTGKSTILRCIALLLCGRDALPELLGPDPSSWIRSGRTSARIDGTVTTAQGDTREMHLELHRGETISKTLDRNAKPLAPLEDALAHTGRSYFLTGYGASRRLGRPGIRGDEQRSARAGRVRTLFDADRRVRRRATDREESGPHQAAARRTKGRSWRLAPGQSAPEKETRGKCAYCESTTSTVAYGDVEHFRPNSVYWWLAYCYDNFSYSCQLCNHAVR